MREIEMKDEELKEMQSKMRVMKEKLEEALRNLESNAQMITWLNK